MADQRPGEPTPAAGEPDPTRIQSDPTQAQGDIDPSTVDAPARWSGSAAVRPPGPKKSRWPRRQDQADPAGPADEPTAVDPHDWAATPAVDPWADQDTPWDAFPLAADPAPQPMPPTRIDAPAPPRPTPTPPPALPPASAGRSKSGRRGRKDTPAPPVNRLPVQTRPPAGPTVSGRPVPPPPPWATPQPQRPLPPPRRKRRWGRRIALFTLLGIVCCCGAPAAYLSFPAARQYPVSAALPRSFADLNRRDDGTSKKAADRLAQQLRDTDAAADDVFAAVYADGRGKRVTVFGVTGWRFTPGSDARAQLDRLTDEFDLSDVQEYSLGEAGAHEQCGTGRTDDGTSVVVCAWADHGSLATVLLTRRSVTDSAELVARLRNAVLTPG
ncbi:hypothetical protein ACWKSP_23435 [Micromonosporaceae bacterium Da 78-11]